MMAKIKPMIEIKIISSVVCQIMGIFSLLIPWSTSLAINKGSNSSKTASKNLKIGPKMTSFL